MDRDWTLKLQAYADGELSAREASGIEAKLAGDPEAQKLLRELKMTDEALAGFERELKAPESREFYWSKIERAIQTQRNTTRGAEGVWRVSAWWRLVMPGAAVAGLALAISFVALQSRRQEDFKMQPAESTLADSGAMTYRDYSAGATFGLAVCTLPKRSLQTTGSKSKVG